MVKVEAEGHLRYGKGCQNNTRALPDAEECFLMALDLQRDP